jgi:hypothetical protein
MLLLPFMLVACLTSLVLVFTRWKRHRFFALLPLAACLVSLVAPLELARPIRAALRAWAFPSYERLVARIESGDIEAPSRLARMPGLESEARLAYAVFAERDSDSVLTVEILTEGGFPVRHSGYLYCSRGAIAPGSHSEQRWKRRKEIGKGWYSISD